MAKNFKISKARASAAMDLQCTACDGGVIRIYEAPQAADVDTAVGAQTLLAELTFGSPAFGAAVDGVATANAITKDASANASGTAGWYRAFAADGVTAVADGSVGIADADLVLNSVTVVAGAEVTITALVWTQPTE